ncbi:hypothetical protein Tco_0613601 [Tanacetum coccineum]
MPRKSSEDYKNRHYIPKIPHEFRSPIKEKLRNLKERYIHEGRVVFDNFTDLNYVQSLFHFFKFECLLEINEQVCPRFILEFYSQYHLSYSDEGACVFTDRWRLDELAYGIPSDDPYQINPPSIKDIISSTRIDQDGQVRCIRHEEEIDVHDYQILTREIIPTLKPLEEIIQEKVFCLGAKTKKGSWHEKRSSFYFFFFRLRSTISHLILTDDDDGNDEGTSRASTPSPIRYVNSLTNQVPQVFQNPPNIDPHLEPFYTRQTKIINRQVQLRDEHRGGVRSIGKSLRRLWRNMKK